MKPVLSRERCVAQAEICPSMKVCAPGALSYMEDEAEPLGGRMEIDYALCTECGLCIDACCGKAFNIDKVS